jgi:tRNA-splicing ligase RtcB
MEKKAVAFSDLIKINDNLFEISSSFRPDMQVPARVYMTADMFEDIKEDLSLVQLVNMTTLPGVANYAIAMPDIHQGYGFPIGGVLASAIDQGGIISPGGIGYDINCGVRMMVSPLTLQDVKKILPDLATALFGAIPSGVGRGGRVKLDTHELDNVLRDGAKHMVALGYGNDTDLEFCEENGMLPGAAPELISKFAKERGHDQLGTLGSGNHFLEVQHVDKIYDEKIAQAFGLRKGMITILIHCGSRGLGHQTCTDYVKIMMAQLPQWGYQLPDKELVCAPFNSREAQDYFAAMSAAANFAWANRHLIGHWVRKTWEQFTGSTLTTLYDLSHNIGKRERHTVQGKEMEVVMHRKGATRAFGPGRLEIPSAYRDVGQPVLIPGTMGTASYVLAGMNEGMQQAFGSSCHGAGRKLSRIKAKKSVRGSTLRADLEAQGILIRCDSDAGLSEEAPLAYKDIDTVVNVIHNAQLARKVARCRPLAVIKGG